MRDYEQAARLQSSGVGNAAYNVPVETLHDRLSYIEGQLNTLAQGISSVADRVVGNCGERPGTPMGPPADSLDEQIRRVSRSLGEAENAFARLTPVL